MQPTFRFRLAAFALLIALLIGIASPAAGQIPDFTPNTPLLRALLYGDSVAAMRLLEAGANPNESRFFGFPPLFFAIWHKDAALVRAMIAKGADIKATDPSGATALMWAAFNEYDETELVDVLLRLGVPADARDRAGNTALSWAMQRGHARISTMLRNAGASDRETTKASAEKAIALLQKSGAQFYRTSGCTSCHHQSLPQMAISAARERSLNIDEQAAREQVKTVALTLEIAKRMTDANQNVPDPAIGISYALVGLGGEHYPADAVTTAMAQVIANEQLADGSFRTVPARPPMEASKFTSTALSLRALQLYGANLPGGKVDWRIANAVTWLRAATPRSTEERIMQLLGMAWGKADKTALREAANRLLDEQKSDGGWAQLPGIQTDAYATGQALVALYQSQQIDTSDRAYQRGMEFLLRTQLADGSWLVYTRTYPMQPPKDSGFPHGKHQWISAAGSSWAAMALSYAVAPAPDAASSGRE